MRWLALLVLRTLLVSFAGTSSLAACGDDDASTAGTNPTKRNHDGGVSTPRRDAAVPAGPDHELRSGETYLCGWDDDDMLQLPGSSAFGEVAIATDERGFAVVHHDADGALRVEAIPVGGAAEPSVRLIDGADAPGRSALAAADERFLLLYRDGSSLQARILVEGANPRALSDQLAEPEAGGERFALTALDDRFVAAWIDTTPALVVQALDLDGTPIAEPVTLDTLAQGGALDLQLGRLDDGRVLLAWHERDDADEGRVMAVPLDTKLAPERDPVQLSKNAVPEPRFDLGARQLGAGVIYQAREGGIRDTVKYRRVDPEGTADQPELAMVNAPGRARDGAIAAFGQGYAVAYRALPSLGVEHAAIRVAFINEFGRIVYEDELAETSENGGRTSVSASGDGHLVVGWSSAEANGETATRAVQLDCPGALILCGGGITH